MLLYRRHSNLALATSPGIAGQREENVVGSSFSTNDVSAFVVADIWLPSLQTVRKFALNTRFYGLVGAIRKCCRGYPINRRAVVVFTEAIIIRYYSTAPNIVI